MKKFLLMLFSALAVLSTAAAAAPLSDAERADLLYMIEEEKLAHDVYLTFQRKYRERVFPNIRLAEQQHQDAMAGLLQRYGLADPRYPAVGRFRDARLQSLFDELIAQGSKSRVEAIRVGAWIEETDIRDIANAVARTDEWAIRRVYGNLSAGSENHLRAFVGRLDRLGVDYEPEVLSSDEFVAIVGP